MHIKCILCNIFLCILSFFLKGPCCIPPLPKQTGKAATPFYSMPVWSEYQVLRILNPVAPVKPGDDGAFHP